MRPGRLSQCCRLRLHKCVRCLVSTCRQYFLEILLFMPLCGGVMDLSRFQKSCRPSLTHPCRPFTVWIFGVESVCGLATSTPAERHGLMCDSKFNLQLRSKLIDQSNISMNGIMSSFGHVMCVARPVPQCSNKRGKFQAMWDFVSLSTLTHNCAISQYLKCTWKWHISHNPLLYNRILVILREWSKSNC